jgi:hypothetical protein
VKPPQAVKKKRTLWEELSPLLPVVAGAGVVYALWLWNWPKLLLAAGVGLTVFCWRRKRVWKERDAKSLPYILFDKSLEFFVPLTAVMLCYAALAWVVDGAGDQTTLGRLEQLERLLDSLNSYLSWFKLKPWVAALVIASVMAVDFSLSLFFRYRDMASLYKHYGLWSKRVSTVVLLLCCFTFFGNAVGERRARLRTRTDNIREGYARIQERAEEMLSGSVQQRLYQKVYLAFPSAADAQSDYLKRTGAKLDDLRVSLKYADALGVKDERAEEIVRRHEAGAGKTAGPEPEPIHYAAEEPLPGPRPATPPPADVSEASVKKTLAEIETKESFRSRFVSLLKMEGTRQLYCQFPKSFTSVVKGAAFKAAIANYPFLEPVIDIFTGTFDKVVEQKVKGAVDAVADGLLKNPQAADELVSGEAEKIVQSTEVKSAPESVASIKRSAAAVEAEVRQIESAAKMLDRRMNSAAAAKASELMGGDGRAAGGPSGRVTCTCRCGSRVVWGPTTFSSYAQCVPLCPPVPCG